MTLGFDLLTPDFRALSARLGRDPLQVQGAGGNTSIKNADVMWIKASGMELADAESRDIFVPVDRHAALDEARGVRGDGSCKNTVIDDAISLRPSIETTFHAALDHAVVAHTHSVATLVHATSLEGIAAARDKLDGLAYAVVPYVKPGLRLTQQIMQRVKPDTKVIILQSHGLICCGSSVDETSDLLAEVELRLTMPARDLPDIEPGIAAPDGFRWAEESWIAHDARAYALATAGSYYPDHVVFLGSALPVRDSEEPQPAIIKENTGIALRTDASSPQRALLRCLSDYLSRLPENWTPVALGADVEAELMNWDAEKYRLAMVAKK